MISSVIFLFCFLAMVAIASCLLYRLTVTERALRNLLAALESQGKDMDDLQCLHDAVQAAYKVVGNG